MLQRFQVLGLESSPQVQTQPQSGQLLLYDRAVVKHFRRDVHEWKKKRSPVCGKCGERDCPMPGSALTPNLLAVCARALGVDGVILTKTKNNIGDDAAGRDGKTVREDHEKLKIDSIERLTCCYAHSEEMPTFHRRIYWLLPTAASAPGGGGGGDGGGGGGVSTSAAADDGDSSAGGSVGADVGETAPVAPAAGYGGKAAAKDTSNLNTEASTLVLVHYLDERHIVSDPNEPASKGARGTAQRRARQSQSQAHMFFKSALQGFFF